MGGLAGESFILPDFVRTLAHSRESNICGRMHPLSTAVGLGEKMQKPDARLNLSDEIQNEVVCCVYEYPERRKHVTSLLPNAIIPRRSITMRDVVQIDRRRAGESIALKYLLDNNSVRA